MRCLIQRKKDEISHSFNNRVSNVEILQNEDPSVLDPGFDIAAYRNRAARDEEIIRMESILADQRNRLNEYQREII